MPTKNGNGAQKRRRDRSASATSKPKTPPPAENSSASGSSSEALRKLYSSLLRCRLVQECVRDTSTAAEAQYDIRIGREAVTVGATGDLADGDTIAAGPRNLAALIARGAPPTALLAHASETNHTASGFAPGLPEDPFNLGTGVALAHKLEQKRRVVVAFCAQEKPPLQVWHDALAFAAAHRLPIIFVIENGVSGDGLPCGEAPHLEAFSFFARDYGFPGIIVDGSDVVAVWRVAQEAVHRARNGSGPTLIDCRTDGPRDPLAHLEHYLRKRQTWDDGWKKQVELSIRSEIQRP